MSRLFEKPFFVLSLLAILTLFPSIFMLPVTDRDEARFVQASKQMMETGNYTKIMNQDTPRLKKPYGIYWMQCAAVKLTGADLNQAWGYRLPSAFAALFAILFFAYFCKRLFGPRVSLLASLILLSSVLLQVESTLGKTDTVLFFFSTVALGSLLLRFYDENSSPGWIYAFWIALGMTIFIKGPVIPTFFLLGGIAYWVFKKKVDKPSFASLKKLSIPLGLLIIVLMNAPWIYLLQTSSQGQFLQDSVGQDLLQKLFRGMESHGAHPGFYTMTVFVSFLPGSLFLIPAIIKKWKSPKDPLAVFLISFIVPGWILLELVPTKLPHYIFPFFPVLAIFVAQYLSRWKTPQRAVQALGILRIAVLVLTPFVICTLGYFFGAPITWTLFCFIGVFISICIFLLWQFSPRKHPLEGLLLTTMAVLVAIKYTLAVHVPDFWITQKIHQTLEKTHNLDSQLIAVGYPELSLAFYLGTDVRFSDTASALQLAENSKKKSSLLIEHSQLKEPIPETFTPLSTFRGFHYSKGRWRTFTLYETR